MNPAGKIFARQQLEDTQKCELSEKHFGPSTIKWLWLLWRQISLCVLPQPACYFWMLTAWFWERLASQTSCCMRCFPWVVVSHHFVLRNLLKRAMTVRFKAVSSLEWILLPIKWLLTCASIDQGAAHHSILWDWWLFSCLCGSVFLQFSFPLSSLAFPWLSQWLMLE